MLTIYYVHQGLEVQMNDLLDFKSTILICAICKTFTMKYYVKVYD